MNEPWSSRPDHVTAVPVEMVPDPQLPWVRRFRFGECYVFVSWELGLWHMSISHPDRYPTWDEIRDARYALISLHLTMSMLLPPPEFYVNLSSNVFHLWECRDPRTLKAMKGER